MQRALSAVPCDRAGRHRCRSAGGFHQSEHAGKTRLRHQANLLRENYKQSRHGQGEEKTRLTIKNRIQPLWARSTFYFSGPENEILLVKIEFFILRWFSNRCMKHPSENHTPCS